MTETEKKLDPKGLAWGLLLIALGALFLLENLDVASIGFLVRRYWPMIVVAVGLPKLFDRATVWSGLWLVAVGGWLQMCHMRIAGLTYGSSWPLLLIVLGGGMIARALIEGFARPAERGNHE